MKKIITDYLVAQCEVDEALREKFNPEQMDDCVKYVKDIARNMKDNNEDDESECLAVEDNTVFGWAVDFFKLGKAEVEAEHKRQAEEDRKRREEEARIRKEEEDKRKAEEKERKAKENAEKKFQEEQHKDGQTSLLDFC